MKKKAKDFGRGIRLGKEEKINRRLLLITQGIILGNLRGVK